MYVRGEEINRVENEFEHFRNLYSSERKIYMRAAGSIVSFAT